MLCQLCGKNQANVHVKQIINNVKTELLLCEECAGNLGLSNIIEDNFDSEFEDLFGSFFPSYTTSTYRIGSPDKRCSKCGTSFKDISSTGKLGCANCYKTFYDSLLPYIRRIHGDTSHSGKVAACTKKNTCNCESKIKELQKQLEVAVSNQEFEQAAVLRDKIKELSQECYPCK